MNGISCVPKEEPRPTDLGGIHPWDRRRAAEKNGDPRAQRETRLARLTPGHENSQEDPPRRSPNGDGRVVLAFGPVERFVQLPVQGHAT